MRIDFTNKIVFLANTKVASSSFETALVNHASQIGRIDGHPSIKHLNLKQYLDIATILGTQKFLTACVIRHPLDKVLSWYSYRARPALHGKPRYTGNMTLAEFIACAPEQEIDDRYFVYDRSRGKQVDLIFKYDEIEKFIKWLQGVYGPDFSLPRKNVSPKKKAIDSAELELARERFSEAVAWYETLRTTDGTSSGN